MQFMEVAHDATPTYVTVPLGGLTTVEAILAISDYEVSYKINSAAVGVATKMLCMRGCAITALTVSNASGSMASIRFVLAGT